MLYVCAKHPKAFMAITGWFNHVTRDKWQPISMLTAPLETREQRTSCIQMQRSIQCLCPSITWQIWSPSCLCLVHRLPVYTKNVSSGLQKLMRDSFESTEWDVLFESNGEDISNMTGSITEYIKFCEDITQSAAFLTTSHRRWKTTDTWVLTSTKDWTGRPTAWVYT